MGCRAASACVDATGVTKPAWIWHGMCLGGPDMLVCCRHRLPLLQQPPQMCGCTLAQGQPLSGQGWCTKAEYACITCHQRSWQLIAVWELTLILLCFIHLLGAWQSL